MAHKPKDPAVEKAPGPGAYNPNYEIMKKKLPKWGMKDRVFQSNHCEGKKLPGPG